ncbi:MAG: PAS domain S-box protein [Desulfobacterales bacterium]|jgi:PAS domain S-box-containing protein
MQKQTIKSLIITPQQDHYIDIDNLLQRIEKWRFEVQWASDVAVAIRDANAGSFDILLVDDHFGQDAVSYFLAELEKEACVTPVILLISNEKHLDDFETVIAKTAGYVEKNTLSFHQLERLIRDALALYKAAGQVRENESRLRGIFYGAAIGIALFNLEGQIVEPNPALSKITGFSSEELCTFFLKDLFGRSASHRINALFSDLIEGRREFFQVEERFRQKAGKDIWIRMTASQYKDQQLPVEFGVGLFEDITERKQAEEEAERAGRRMLELSRQILEAQENERKLVAQEIHDSIGGHLAAIKFALEEKLESMGQNPSSEGISLEKIIAYVDEAISESRRISVNLRPSLLDDLGLLATISWFCREFEKVHLNLQIEQQLEVKEDEIPEMSKVVIYRVLQEAMNNVAKHSDATRVRLHLAKNGNRMEFSVADNGRGFDPEKKFSESTTVSGFGLLGMRDRTILCDGRFEVASKKGEGTTVHISLPCDGTSIEG